MTWYNASSYCFDNGGILESNETIIKEYSLNITNKGVWTGSYNILTEWYGIWGKLIIIICQTSIGGCLGHDRIVVGFKTTYASSSYHNLHYEFESCSGAVYSIQHYVIKFVNDLRQVGVFLLVLRFPRPIKLIPRYD